MKILRVFGVVVGIHLFAFLVIFANPGCSSTNKPAPSAADTVTKSETPPAITPPSAASASASSSPISAAPMSGGEVAPAISFTPPASSRYAPTRPGTTAAAALEAAPVADVTPASTYTVAAGDSLSVIAKRNKITPAELAAANNLKITSPIRQGQKLIIPAKQAPTPAPMAAAPAHAPAASAPAEKPTTEVIKHTVKAGEALSTIAKKYGVKMGDLAVANNITDPAKIRPGQELIIKGAKSKPASTASSPSGATTSAASAKPAAAPAAPAAAAPANPDLDSGLRPATSFDVPVIKVEEAPPAK